MIPTNGQPQTMTTGPPVFMPNPYRVRQPDRIEMMVNETAKFENPDIRRISSWAYPSLCRVASSLPAAGTACSLTDTARSFVRTPAFAGRCGQRNPGGDGKRMGLDPVPPCEDSQW